MPKLENMRNDFQSPPNSIGIGGHVIGEGQRCFVLAEAGVNHNGDIELAKRLVDAAAAAGADAVKFQTFTAESIVTPDAVKPAYQIRTVGTKETQFQMLKKLELSEGDHRTLKRHADDRGIMFLSTPYDRASVDFLIELGVPALKVSSADITNHPLLESMAATGLPVILSTGMSTLSEVEAAVAVINGKGNPNIVLLHCNFNYPANPEDVNLRAMATLQRAFGYPTGYSDHTMGLEVSLAAVALGAAMIEKHFTLDREMPGPDHKASLEPAELEGLVAGIRTVEKAFGSPEKRPTGDEVPNRLISRRSLVAAEVIPAGTTITQDMLGSKRPGSGLSPALYRMLIGRKAVETIQKDELITWNKVR